MKNLRQIVLVLLVLYPPTVSVVTAAPDAVITRVMQAADKNRDGKLSLDEYLPLDVQAVHHGKEHFTAGDANRDGFLDPVELAATLEKQTWFAILCEGVNACFTRLDTNHDGKLDAAEYRRISRMGHHAEQHFKSADTNKDGSLSPKEFAAHAEAILNALERGAVKREAADP